MNKIILKIEGMTCSACSSGLEKYLKKQKGVNDALVNLVMATASIEYEDFLTIDDLNRFVKEAGFKSMGLYVEDDDSKDSNKTYYVFNGLIAFLVLYISMSHMIGLPSIPFLNMAFYPINYSVCLCLFAIYFIFFGNDIIKNGIKNLFHREPNMDSLVTLGVIFSFGYSFYNMILIFLGNNVAVDNLYFESICIILYLVKLGRFIDDINKEKTKEAIKGLVSITPKEAYIKDGDSIKAISLDMVKQGDILVIKPGMRIAVDGEVVDGESYVDESFISGESSPVKKMISSKVVAGSINIDGVLSYRAERIGKDSTISEIVRLVVEATNTKAPISRVADRVCGIFVPIIIAISVITFLGYLILGFEVKEAFVSFVSVLVVACPCALGLATPLAIVISEGVCASNGILVKNSETLENAHKVDTIVFDKTGTLTYGTLKVSKLFNYGELSEKEVLNIISSLESNSSHPIASAFKGKYKNLKIKDYKNIEGVGLSGYIDNEKYLAGNNKIFSMLKVSNQYVDDERKLQEDGCSIVYLFKNKEVLAMVGVKDVVRDEAKLTIEKLEVMGKEVIMLTGDNEKTASIIASNVGISKVIANVLPKEKADVIRDLKKTKKVMMIGDGINDAPSLALADIGVSLKNGTDIAFNSASVILLRNNLSDITNLLDISFKTIRNIKQNLFWAFFYNACMIPIAMGLFRGLGIEINPMIAGCAMTLSSLTVVLNALRLKNWRRK